MEWLLANFGLLGDIIVVICGVTCLVFGGELLVRGATGISVTLRIAPIVVGLTVVAFMTSAPEFSVSMASALANKPDFVIGNVIGSCLCNILMVLGVTAVLHPIQVTSRLIRIEIPIMIAVSGLVFLFAIAGSDAAITEFFENDIPGKLRRGVGLVFVLGLLLYNAWVIHEAMRYRDLNTGVVEGAEENVERLTEVVPRGWISLIHDLSAMAIGLGLLVWGADMLVRGGSKAANDLGVPEMVVALTLLAVGTSLPELIVSVLAAARGKIDLAVGNVVGSNIFNILGVLGGTVLLTRGGVEVNSQAMRFDIPVLLMASLACLVIAWTGHRITRGEGIALLVAYALYLLFLVVAATA